MRTLLGPDRTPQNGNFAYPRHPRPKYFVLLLALLVSWNNAKAQALLGYDQYALSLKRFLNEQWTAERAEYTAKLRGQKWAAVPSVGLAFGLPSVNLNTGQLANYKAQQGINDAKLKSLDARFRVLLNEQLLQLRIAVEKTELERQKLMGMGDALSTRERIFKIYLEARDKHEMKPLDFLQKQLEFQAAQQDYATATQNYSIQVLEVERLAHYNLPNENIWYVDGEPEGIKNQLDVEPSKLPQSIFTKSTTNSRPAINRLRN